VTTLGPKADSKKKKATDQPGLKKNGRKAKNGPSGKVSSNAKGGTTSKAITRPQWTQACFKLQLPPQKENEHY
jgi:hypothetical protein